MQLLLLAVYLFLVLQDLSFVQETQSQCSLLNFRQTGILSIECSVPLCARRIVDRLHSFGSTGLTLFGFYKISGIKSSHFSSYICSWFYKSGSCALPHKHSGDPDGKGYVKYSFIKS